MCPQEQQQQQQQRSKTYTRVVRTYTRVKINDISNVWVNLAFAHFLGNKCGMNYARKSTFLIIS
jgi:hypothetical protein